MELSECGKRGDRNCKGERRWSATVGCILYMIWSDRNKIIFERKKGDILESILDIQLKTFEGDSQGQSYCNRSRELDEKPT